MPQPMVIDEPCHKCKSLVMNRLFKDGWEYLVCPECGVVRDRWERILDEAGGKE